MTGTDIGCGHCGRPLEDCDCGVDYEIAYRPSAVEIEDADSAAWRLHYVPAIIAHVALVLAAIVLCFIRFGDF